MAKKGDPKEAVRKVTSARKLKELLASARSAKNDISEIAGGFGSEIKAAVEKNHLHRKAFRAAIAEDRMEPEKLAEYYEQLDYYRDVLGLLERAQNAPKLPMGEATEGEEEGETGNGTVHSFPAPKSVAAE
jgi:hypothetical protein